MKKDKPKRKKAAKEMHGRTRYLRLKIFFTIIKAENIEVYRIKGEDIEADVMS